MEEKEIRVKLPWYYYQFIHRYRLKKRCSTKEAIIDAIQLLIDKYGFDESTI